MSELKITIHAVSKGMCTLSGKDADGATVTFENGAITEQHLSWRSLRQLVAMSMANNGAKPAPNSGAKSKIAAAPDGAFDSGAK
jgi:hypothetical protein